MRTLLVSLSLLVPSTLVLLGACADTDADCKDTLSCLSPGAGGTGTTSSNGGTSGTTSTTTSTGGTGGTASGGAAGEGGSPSSVTGSTTGGAGGEAGGGQALPCDGACEGSTPECDETSNRCVQCTESTEAERCAEPTALCSPEQECVECLGPSDCTEASAPACDDGTCSPCSTNEDCAHLEGLGVCDVASGECVECTGTDWQSCGVNNLGQALVCNSLTRSCSDQTAASSGPCGACVSDATCQAGMLCIQERHLPSGTDLGYVCAREADVEGGTLCSAERPFAQVRSAVLSIDGKQADACVLAVSTCLAHAHFRSRNCETDIPDELDDSVCGEAEITDGICELSNSAGGVNEYQCSVPCLSELDCPDFSVCPTANPRRCSLQVTSPSDD